VDRKEPFIEAAQPGLSLISITVVSDHRRNKVFESNSFLFLTLRKILS